MRRLRGQFLPALVLAFAAVVVAAILRDPPPTAWLTVAAPPGVVIGEPFVARVTLTEPADGTFLHVDLHGDDHDDRPLRCIAAGVPLPVSRGQPDYTATLTIPERTDVARAYAVIYLSTTGRWREHTRVAISTKLPVRARAVAAPPESPVGLVMRDQIHDRAITVPNPWTARSVIAALWLAASVVAWTTWRAHPSPRGAPILPLLCAALCVWEIVDAGQVVVEQARRLAQGWHVYDDRRLVQQVATAAVVLGLGLLVALGVRRSRRRAPALAVAGFALYLVTSIAGMLSLHEIDRVLAFACGPVPLAVFARGLAATAALVGLLGRARRG